MYRFNYYCIDVVQFFVDCITQDEVFVSMSFDIFEISVNFVSSPLRCEIVINNFVTSTFLFQVNPSVLTSGIFTCMIRFDLAGSP